MTWKGGENKARLTSILLWTVRKQVTTNFMWYALLKSDDKLWQLLYTVHCITATHLCSFFYVSFAANKIIKIKMLPLEVPKPYHYRKKFPLHAPMNIYDDVWSIDTIKTSNQHTYPKKPGRRILDNRVRRIHGRPEYWWNEILWHSCWIISHIFQLKIKKF